MKLKVYADRMSQPSRAVIIFCKVNGLDFEEIEVRLAKREQYSPEFKEINPMAKVPAIVDGRLKLFESHAILIYLACAFPGVADHWYPNDLSKRARIHSVLDWHHSNLRFGAAKFVLNKKLAPAFGLPLNPEAAAEAEKILSSSLSKIESFWLKGSGRFLVGSNQPSIADISLVCEIMELELLDEEDRTRLLGPHKKVQEWIESTRRATRPHFDEVHKVLFKVKENLQKQQLLGTGASSGTDEGQLNVDESRLIRSCVAGQIYDSSPVDFTSDFCARFGLHPTIQKIPGLSKLVSWVAKGVTSGLDGLCLTRFEPQRAEYWRALYNSVDLGTPFLIICSDNDELAPQQVIYNFARHLLALGGDVKLVKLNGSPHIGHYEYYPIQYRAAITGLLEKAASVYSQRIRQLGEISGMEGTHDEISELICDLQNVAVNSNQSLRRVAVEPSDHFFLPSSTELHSQESGSLQDERNSRSVYLPTPSISAHSVLGEFLFDVCIPKNVEGWDIRFSGSVNGQPYASARRHSPFNKFRCNLRSRL